MSTSSQRTAIVTGGGSGIGAALCRVLGAQGYRVAVSDLNLAAAEKVAAECGGAAFKVDVADESSVVALFESACDWLGKLDALATPAGISDTTPFMELTVEKWMQIYRINVIGTFLCIREAVKRMEPGGRICTVSSVAGKRGGGLAGTAAYSASKGAVLALTRNAARVFGPKGIAVNGVVPAGTKTPMGMQVMPTAEAQAHAMAMHPIGRLAEPEEIAKAIAWLLSPDASFVLGEMLAVDGGVMMD
ncbi:MAG: SDR family oxidoreductase [Candidatus Eremiobacteraeota bacterium]|nr:SDR family oxidoreductase [Candidatus Eremiobacteraeota bacterium]